MVTTTDKCVRILSTCFVWKKTNYCYQTIVSTVRSCFKLREKEHILFNEKKVWSRYEREDMLYRLQKITVYSWFHVIKEEVSSSS
jgi:hypothetical protein